MHHNSHNVQMDFITLWQADIQTVGKILRCTVYIHILLYTARSIGLNAAKRQTHTKSNQNLNWKISSKTDYVFNSAVDC